MEIYPVFLPFAGCSQRCSFCDQGALTGQQSGPTPAQLEESLESMLPRQGQGEVAFYGGTFTLLPAAEQQAYLRIVKDFTVAGRVGGSRISTRPDALDEETVGQLFDLGCRTVELGCQSFSADVLRAAGRPYTAEAIEDAVGRLRQRGLAVGLQLMPGLPRGDRSEALASLKAALGLRPDFLRIYPTLVFVGTRLAVEYGRGAFRPWSLPEAVDCCAEMLWCCQLAGVPVIRLGVQGQAGLDGGDGFLAGPYHPAFGQLVKSRLWCWGLLAAQALDATAQWFVHPFDLPDALGHQRENLTYLGHSRQNFVIGADPGLGRSQIRGGGEIYNLIDLVTFFRRNLTT